jgi:hypothetical protein
MKVRNTLIAAIIAAVLALFTIAGIVAAQDGHSANHGDSTKPAAPAEETLASEFHVFTQALFAAFGMSESDEDSMMGSEDMSNMKDMHGKSGMQGMKMDESTCANDPQCTMAGCSPGAMKSLQEKMGKLEKSDPDKAAELKHHLQAITELLKSMKAK